MLKKSTGFLPQLAVILAGTMWGIITVFIKPLAAGGMNSIQICAIRLFIAAILFSGSVLIINPKLMKIEIKDIWMFIGTGVVSLVLFNSLYFYTILESEISIAVVLLYTSPIFVMLMSAVFFKEKITARKIVALIMAFAGLVCVTGLASVALGGTLAIAPITLLAGVGAGFFYATYSIFGEVALKKYNSVTVSAYTFLAGGIGILPICRVDEMYNCVVQDPSLLLWGLLIALFSTIFPYLLYTWGLGKMEPSRASILVAVEPVVGCLMGIIFFNETVGIAKIIGVVLVLAAIIVLNIRLKDFIHEE